MEKYCHFIAIYTLFSASIFFFFSLPKCLFLNLSSVGPPSTSGPPTHDVSGWLAEGGGRGGGENVLSLCQGVIGWDRGSGGSLFPYFSLFVKHLEFVVIVHRQQPPEFVNRQEVWFFVSSRLFDCLWSIFTLRLLRWWCSLGLDRIVCLCQNLMVLLRCWICGCFPIFFCFFEWVLSFW